MKKSIKQLVTVSLASVAILLSASVLAKDHRYDQRDGYRGGKHHNEYRMDGYRGKKHHNDYRRYDNRKNYVYKNHGRNWKHGYGYDRHYRKGKWNKKHHYYPGRDYRHYRGNRQVYHHYDHDDVYKWIGGMYLLNEVLHHNHY